MTATPPTGPAVLGAAAVSPDAEHRLSAGSILSVAPGMKLGVVRIARNGAVWITLFRGGAGTDEPFREHAATLRPGERTSFEGCSVQLVESAPDGSPRRWARFIAG